MLRRVYENDEERESKAEFEIRGLCVTGPSIESRRDKKAKGYEHNRGWIA